MAAGTVKWLNTPKGFGFVPPKDGSRDTFVRLSEGPCAHLEIEHSPENGKSSVTTLRAG